MSVNKAILIGNVGKDPDVRYLDSGTPKCSFSLATSEVYKNKNGEKVTATEWHNIVLWRGLAEIAEKYVRKGSQIYIEGRIRTRSYDDKDGNKKYITEIVGDVLQLLGRRADDGTSSPESSRSQESSGYTETSQSSPENINSEMNETDDLPF